MVQYDPSYANIVNHLIISMILEGWNKHDRDRFFLHFVKNYIWNDPYLFRYYSDQIVKRCVPDHEVRNILSFNHDQAYGGHFNGKMIAANVLQCEFYWPALLKEAHEYYKKCPKCQQLCRITRRDMMPLNLIVVVEIFDVWGKDFVGAFPIYFGNEYILLNIDYVSK